MLKVGDGGGQLRWKAGWRHACKFGWFLGEEEVDDGD